MIELVDLPLWLHEQLLKSDTFSKKVLAKESGWKPDDRDFCLSLHSAIEIMLTDHGIVFQPSGKNGHYRRANPTQIMGRSTRFSSAAKKKLIRASAMLSSIAPSDVPTEERERLRRKQEHAEARASKAMRKARVQKDPLSAT